MRVVSEKYNRGRNILELVDILPNDASLKTREMEFDYY